MEFQSRSQLSKVLQSHRGEQLVITTSEPWEVSTKIPVGPGLEIRGLVVGCWEAWL